MANKTENTTAPAVEETATAATETAVVTEAEVKPAVKPDKSVPAAPKEGSEEWLRERVPIRLFKDSGKYKEDVFVAVNGVGYQIKRGETVEVPRCVALVLEQSLAQDSQAAVYSAGLEDEFMAKSAAYGI